MANYDLTKYEQETLIRYNQEEDAAIIDTCDKKLIRKLDKLCEKLSTITVENQNQYGKTYKLPKKWIKISTPRQLSEKTRKELAERAKSNFVK